MNNFETAKIIDQLQNLTDSLEYKKIDAIPQEEIIVNQEIAKKFYNFFYNKSNTLPTYEEIDEQIKKLTSRGQLIISKCKKLNVLKEPDNNNSIILEIIEPYNERLLTKIKISKHEYSEAKINETRFIPLNIKKEEKENFEQIKKLQEFIKEYSKHLRIEQNRHLNKYETITVDDFFMPIRLLKVLKAKNVKTVIDLYNLGEEELKKLNISEEIFYEENLEIIMKDKQIREQQMENPYFERIRFEDFISNREVENKLKKIRINTPEKLIKNLCFTDIPGCTDSIKLRIKEIISTKRIKNILRSKRLLETSLASQIEFEDLDIDISLIRKGRNYYNISTAKELIELTLEDKFIREDYSLKRELEKEITFEKVEQILKMKQIEQLKNYKENIQYSKGKQKVKK